MLDCLIWILLVLTVGFVYRKIDKATLPSHEEQQRAWDDVFEELLRQSLK